MIFKVWRKPNSTVTTPNMQADNLIGIAALDLTVLLSGFSDIQGWFNIVDYSGKCNGQINVSTQEIYKMYAQSHTVIKQTDLTDRNFQSRFLKTVEKCI